MHVRSNKALEKKTLLMVLLKNEDWEKQFRSSLRIKEPNVVNYLSQEEVLADMIQALVNEEDRTLQEASEVLGIILFNVDAINTALVTSHLEGLFRYLQRNTMNPRRLYFFLRVASFIFQNKSVESLKFAINSPDFTSSIIKHLSSPHILQLMLHILNLEKQMKEMSLEGCDWSAQTNLIAKLVSALKNDPSTFIEPLHKFLHEISNSYYTHQSAFVKNLLTEDECALSRCIIALVKNRSVSTEAIKLLDELLFRIILSNEGDSEFFDKIKPRLLEECEGFYEMMSSKDLQSVIIGVKFMHVLVKQNVSFLLNPTLFNCVDLCFTFKWSNILHNVIVNVLMYVFQSEDTEIIKSFLDAGLLRKLLTGLASKENVGFRPHFRTIILAMKITPCIYAQEVFANDPHWERFWEIMEYRDQKDLTFAEAEEKIRNELTALLNGTDVPSSATNTNSSHGESANVEAGREQAAEPVIASSEATTTATAESVSTEIQETVQETVQPAEVKSEVATVAVTPEEVQTRSENPTNEQPASDATNTEATVLVAQGGEKPAEPQPEPTTTATDSEEASTTTSTATTTAESAESGTAATGTSTEVTPTTAVDSGSEAVAPTHPIAQANENGAAGQGEEIYIGEDLQVDYSNIQCDD